MQTSIFSLIEQLVSMSGSTSNFDTLDSELTLIENEILKIKNEIRELESSMTDDKYFDATQEIVDRNIELSVSKKLNKLEKNFDVLKEKQKDMQDKEHQYIEAIDLLKQKIVKAKRTISIIDARLEKTQDENTKSIYNRIYNEENEKITTLQERLEEKSNLLEKASDDVNDINNKVNNVKKEIEQSASRLLEVRKSLNSKSNYIDEILKNKDLESMINLQSRLDELEEKKHNILTDAIYIASEIKELIIADKNDVAMQKLMELVTIVNARPYMDISDVESLEQELAKLESSQNNLINMIENKEYFGNDVVYLDNRIRHLRKLIQIKNTEIETTRERISQIDNNLVIDVTDELKKAENESEMLEKSLNDYEQLLKDPERKKSSTLVSLQASHNKKSNELKIIRDIIERYSKELSILVETSSGLEEEKISKLNEEINNYKAEIDDLTKIKLLSTKTKDAIAQENDKQKLKEITDNINLLKQRLSFGKTPQEIYDEVEMLMISNRSNIKYDESEGEIKQPEINNPMISDFELSSDDSNNLPDNFENIEPELTNNDMNKNIESNFSLIKDFPEDKPQNDIDLLKDNFVISEPQEIKSIDQNEEEKLDDSGEEYTFSELDDTDYFSLDEFLKNLDDNKKD